MKKKQDNNLYFITIALEFGLEELKTSISIIDSINNNCCDK